MRLKVTFIFLLALAPTVIARADSLKDQLDQQYKKHILSLRSPFGKGDQKFDSAGKPLDPPQEPWLVYGGIYVEEIGLKNDNLSIEGPRVGVNRDKTTHKITLIAQGQAVKIEIHLDQPLQSMDEAHVILDRVFYLDDANMEHAKPEYRRSNDTTVNESLYKVGNDVTPPVAIFTPEPEYNEAARQAKHQGIVVLYVVIDKTGNIARMRLEQALGDGLDENVMEEVKKWRFKPAEKDGHPVAIEMNIEVQVNFHLDKQ